MPRSRAWNTALAARIEIQKLIEIAKEQSDQLEAGRPFSDQENCLRLLMVALIGYFQAYVGDLLNELCDTLPTVWDDAMPLYQKRYILIQVHRRISLILDERKEHDLNNDAELQKFRNDILNCTGWASEPVHLASSGHREDLRGFLKDNGSKSLNKSISQFRADRLSFSDWLDSQHPKYRGVFELLDNVIRIRNDVAHGKIDQRITLREARTYVFIIYRLILKADEYLESSFIITGTPTTAELATATVPAANVEIEEAGMGTETATPAEELINVPAGSEK